MSFLHKYNRQVHREIAPVTVAETVEFFPKLPPTNQGATLLVVVDSRTAGTLTVAVEGSWDGDTYFELPSGLSNTLSANGLTYVELDAPAQSPLPPYLRAALTPAGGFDGSCALFTQHG